MSNDILLTDDYVADLLVKEANDRSLRYSAMGLEAFNTTSKPTNMPKPNTKFLRHIIKDTDNHNKALLAKEAAESRARLRDLERVEESKQRRLNPDTRDLRRRQLGDIQSILGGKRQQSGSDEKPASEERRSRRRDDRDGDSRRSSRKDDDDLVRGSAEGRREYGRLLRSEEGGRSRRRSHRDDEGRRWKRSFHENSSSDEESSSSRHRRHRSKRDPSRSPRRRHRHRSRSPPREKRSKHRHRSPLTQDEESRDKNLQDDSDPLENLIGPAPPPKYRGRGTVAGAAGIDMRFSEFYDPKMDVLPDDEQTADWDDALEAYRDRQKLRQNQESRMRAAGFEDRQIRKLNAPSMQKEKTEEDVVWSKAGVKREWDRGKSDDDGDGGTHLRGIFSEDQ